MASEFLEVFERDKKARQRLLKLLAGDLIESPELRYGVLEAIGAEIATKRDIKEVKEEIKGTEEKLRAEIKSELAATEKRLKEDLKGYVDVKFEALNRRIDDLGSRINDLFKVTVSTLIAIVVGMLGLFLSRVV